VQKQKHKRRPMRESRNNDYRALQGQLFMQTDRPCRMRFMPWGRAVGGWVYFGTVLFLDPAKQLCYDVWQMVDGYRCRSNTATTQYSVDGYTNMRSLLRGAVLRLINPHEKSQVSQSSPIGLQDLDLDPAQRLTAAGLWMHAPHKRKQRHQSVSTNSFPSIHCAPARSARSTHSQQSVEIPSNRPSSYHHVASCYTSDFIRPP